MIKSSKIPKSKVFQKLIIYKLKPCSLNPTTSSSMNPALQNQKTISREVISIDRSLSTATNRPRRIANEQVEKNCRYLGTLNLDNLKRDASLGSYKVTVLLVGIACSVCCCLPGDTTVVLPYPGF